MTKVYIVMEDGCLRAVLSSDPGTRVVFMDRDEAEYDKAEARRQARLDATIEKQNAAETLWYVY